MTRAPSKSKSRSVATRKFHTSKETEIKLAAGVAAVLVYFLAGSPLNYLTRLTESIAPLQPTFSLLNGPAGMSIDATTGEFNYTPTESDVAKDFAVGVRVTDNASPSRSDEASFALHVLEANLTQV